jgi:hypothetical protein
MQKPGSKDSHVLWSGTLIAALADGGTADHDEPYPCSPVQLRLEPLNSSHVFLRVPLAFVKARLIEAIETLGVLSKNLALDLLR